ncbi:hypothetical protein ACO0LL_11385 [Undibacterium sp. TC4M20W]|uniref:hypothetical protein n=1 Tax=Undibacterium sp. TC4M20W TaxID=3413052 RepID=UPI003BF358CE
MFDDINALNFLIVLAILLPLAWLAYRSCQGSNAAWYVLYAWLAGSVINVCLGLPYFMVTLIGFVLIGFVCRQKLMVPQFFKNNTEAK